MSPDQTDGLPPQEPQEPMSRAEELAMRLFTNRLMSVLFTIDELQESVDIFKNENMRPILEQEKERARTMMKEKGIDPANWGL